MNFLGLDIGTGGSRAIIVDEYGKVLASSTVEHANFVSPQIGWAEQDPHDWWRAASEAIRNVYEAEMDEVKKLAAIGLSGQMHGAVLLDEFDRIVRPAIIWCDQRTEEQCEELNRDIGKEELIKLVCNPALPNMTLTKLLWVRKYEPENWSRVKSVMLPKDYVRFRLTGQKATDMTDASGTLLLDVENRKWSRSMLSIIGLESEILPSLYDSHEITGEVSKECSAETGLRKGIPVVAGAGDNAAGAIGMGIVRPGETSVTIGTSGVAFTVTDKPQLDLEGRIHTFCHAIPNRWHLTGVTQSAGFSLRWFRDNFSDSQNYDELVKSAESVPPGADGLLWTPYLMGERTPHLDPNARASLVGLSASHTKSHVVRAILEGVAFSLKDCLEIFRELEVPIDNIKLGGGGAKSVLWRQIQADVYNQPVESIAVEEGAAFGAALLAGVGVGAWSSLENACASTIKIGSIVEPTPQGSKIYATVYEKYKLVYPALSSF